jgi:uncharacterized protein (TIGR03435 family)
MRSVFLTVTLAAAALAQTAPSFEVASIRVSEPGKREGGENPMKRDMRTGIMAQVSPDGVIIRNSSLRSIICWAYRMFDYQLKGPDWLGAARFDITAKAGREATNEELRLMLRTLLADRFKMVSHTDNKEMGAYVLTIAKSGLKVKESTSGDGDFDIEPNQQKMSVTVKRAGIDNLCDALGNIFKAPIIDQTGLKGKYDATFDIMKYMADMRPTESGTPPDPLAIIIRGLQEELGLKLEPKKTQVDLLIVEKIEKTAAEN